MIVNFYAIKNRFTNLFSTPFPSENDSVAIYSVRQIVNEQKEPSIIPSDFSLYYVGQFDETIGLFYTIDSPVVLVEDCSVLVVKEVESE